VLAAASRHLNETRQAIGQLHARAVAVRSGFATLPRLAEDTGKVPDPIHHEAWDG